MQHGYFTAAEEDGVVAKIAAASPYSSGGFGYVETRKVDSPPPGGAEGTGVHRGGGSLDVFAGRVQRAPAAVPPGPGMALPPVSPARRLFRMLALPKFVFKVLGRKIIKQQSPAVT